MVEHVVVFRDMINDMNTAGTKNWRNHYLGREPLVDTPDT